MQPETKRLEPRLRDGHEHPLRRARQGRPGFLGVAGSLKCGMDVSEHTAEKFRIEVPKLVKGSPKPLHESFHSIRARLVVTLKRLKPQSLRKLAEKESRGFFGIRKRGPNGRRIGR